MGYKLIKRINKGRETIGYVLIYDNKELEFSKEIAFSMTEHGEIINAEYNRRTRSLIGKNGTNLRTIPVIHRPTGIPKINKKVNTNHKLAVEYLRNLNNIKLELKFFR